MSNIQVTHDTNLNNARSESSIAINPRNPLQIVAGSKKFKNIQNYDFTLATSYSTDGGSTWQDSADLPIPGWSGISDPALAWDDAGNVFLIGLAFTIVPNTNPPRMDTIGIVSYKSTDGGKTWSNPKSIHTSGDDDKQWAAGDSNPASPYHGRVYVVWDDKPGIRFARTLDHGTTWIGTGADIAGSIIINQAGYPEINVSLDGTIYIVCLGANAMGGTEIKMIVSNNGGDSFYSVPSPATNISTLNQQLPHSYGVPVFPGGNFRVYTLPTACVFGQTVAVAWADYRDKVSRIYYALSTNGGASWTTGPSGQPLLTNTLPLNQQHFHPQIVSDPYGVIGCAFYEFGPKSEIPKPHTKIPYLIDVIMAYSFDGGGTFSKHFTVTDQPWDPTVDAPWAHGNSHITFIGDYFGLDASSNGFHPLWTDTRTGIQELWTSHVHSKWIHNIPEQVAQILFGIINDASGIEIIGGHVKPVPGGPGDPAVIDILLGTAMYRIATMVSGQEGVALQEAAMNMIVKVAQRQIQSLSRKKQEKS